MSGLSRNRWPSLLLSKTLTSWAFGSASENSKSCLYRNLSTRQKRQKHRRPPQPHPERCHARSDRPGLPSESSPGDDDGVAVVHHPPVEAKPFAAARISSSERHQLVALARAGSRTHDFWKKAMTSSGELLVPPHKSVPLQESVRKEKKRFSRLTSCQDKCGHVAPTGRVFWTRLQEAVKCLTADRCQLMFVPLACPSWRTSQNKRRSQQTF